MNQSDFDADLWLLFIVLLSFMIGVLLGAIVEDPQIRPCVQLQTTSQ